MNGETNMPSAPKISIVMAAYNEQQGIGKAIESIIAQSFEDWELILVDDGSTDSTVEIVRGYAKKDGRIKLVRNSSNLELSASLNKGIGLARAEFIARADADDINLPERLSLQYEFMLEHSLVDVLGTAAFLLDADGQRVGAYSRPCTHAELKALPFLKIQFFHPSVMIRRRFFDQAGLYDAAFPNAEDKEIWLRGLNAGCQYANLPEPLIEYSTGGYVKSWRALRKHAASLIRIAKKHNVKRGYLDTLVLTAYTAAIKLRVYKPRSIRSQ